MTGVDVSALQDSEVGYLELEENIGYLDEWLTWAPTEGFDIDGLICSGDEGHGSEVTELDHAKGLCSEFCAYEGLRLNSPSPTSSNNTANCKDINIQSRREDIPTVLQPESNCQAREAAQGLGDKTSWENPDSKRLLRLVKNREAASQSRKKKKSYIQDLESKCHMWENYCNQLQQSIAFTCAENTVLRDELFRCKRQKGCNGVAEPAVPKDSLPSESPSHLTTLAVVGHLTGVRCLGWLLATLILLLLGEAVKPSIANSATHTKNGFKSSTFWVFIILNEKRSVFESYPGTRSRALSSCRHRYWMLKGFLQTFGCRLA